MRERLTVDRSEHPDVVVLYLGIRANELRAVGILIKLRAQLNELVKHPPDGLLAHEAFWWSLFPLHVGFRQFWRDPDSMDRYAHSSEHRDWWRKTLDDSHRATSLWHEAYFSGGGLDLLYTDMNNTVGWPRFAPTEVARGQSYSSRGRAGLSESGVATPEIAESTFYDPAPNTMRGP